MESRHNGILDLAGLRTTGAHPLFPDKGALTHHLVAASSISFALPRAAELIHSAAAPLPHAIRFAGFAWGPQCRRWYGLRPTCALRGQPMLPCLRASVIIVCAVAGSMVCHARHLPSQIYRSTRHALRVRHVCDALRGTKDKRTNEGGIII